MDGRPTATLTQFVHADVGVGGGVGGVGGGTGGTHGGDGGGDDAPPSWNGMLSSVQSSPPNRLLPCADKDPVYCVPVRTVSCASTTGCEVAPCSGSIKNTAPLSLCMPTDSDHDEKSMPIVLSAPGIKAGPSMPMVRKLSNSASATIGKNAGLVYDATESGKRG